MRHTTIALLLFLIIGKITALFLNLEGLKITFWMLNGESTKNSEYLSIILLILTLITIYKRNNSDVGKKYLLPVFAACCGSIVVWFFSNLSTTILFLLLLCWIPLLKKVGKEDSKHSWLGWIFAFILLFFLCGNFSKISYAQSLFSGHISLFDIFSRLEFHTFWNWPYFLIYFSIFIFGVIKSYKKNNVLFSQIGGIFLIGSLVVFLCNFNNTPLKVVLITTISLYLSANNKSPKWFKLDLLTLIIIFFAGLSAAFLGFYTLLVATILGLCAWKILLKLKCRALVTFLICFSTTFILSFPYAENLCFVIGNIFFLPGIFLPEILIVAILAFCENKLSPKCPIFTKFASFFISIFLLGTMLLDICHFWQLGQRLRLQSLTMSDNIWLVIKSSPAVFITIAVLLILFTIVWFFIDKNDKSSNGLKLKATPFHWAIFLYLILGYCATPAVQWRSPAFINICGNYLEKITENIHFSDEQLEKYLSQYSDLKQNKNTKSEEKNLNVILIILESMPTAFLQLYDYEKETQPLLSKYKNKMEIFTNFYSNYPNSFHSRFSIYSGLYPGSDYASYINPHIQVPTIWEYFAKKDYDTTLFYSSFHEYTRLSTFLSTRKITNFLDARKITGYDDEENHVSWGIKEHLTLAEMKSYLQKRAEDKKKFFISYIPAAPHQPYDNIPEKFHKFPKGGEIVRNFTNVYLNSMLYMDWILHELIKEVQDLGLLENSLIVITNDHGEGVKDAIGHGFDVSPKISQQPLIIIQPGRNKVKYNDTRGSLIDILPTILDLNGIEIPQKLYHGQSIYDENRVERKIFLNSMNQRGLISGDDYFVFADKKIVNHYKRNSNKVWCEHTEKPEPSTTEEILQEINHQIKFQNYFIKNYQEIYNKFLKEK